jgi:hypothetical protein
MVRQTYPLTYFPAYPRVPWPDPGPSWRIEGVSSELAKEIDLLDSIQTLTSLLSPEAAKPVREAVLKGYAHVQKQMPEGIELVF